MHPLLACTWILAICTAELGALAPLESAGEAAARPPTPVTSPPATGAPPGPSGELATAHNNKAGPAGATGARTPPSQEAPGPTNASAGAQPNSTSRQPALVDQVQAVAVSGGSGDENSARPGQFPAASGWQVVCNNRCECLVAELGPATNASQAPGAANANNEAGQALIAFGEDYSLDYEDELDEQQHQHQQRDDISPDGPGPAAGDKLRAGSGAAKPAAGPAEPAAGNQDERSPAPVGPNQSSGQPEPGGAWAPSRGAADARPPNRNESGPQQAPSDQQPLTGGPKQPQLGQQQPPPQLLYAQSLYSSNPKLSFHAHVPHYLKPQVAPSPSDDHHSAPSAVLPTPMLKSSHLVPAGQAAPGGHQATRLGHHLGLHHQLQPHHVRHLSHGLPVAATNPRLLGPQVGAGAELQLQAARIRRLVALRTLDLSRGQLMGAGLGAAGDDQVAEPADWLADDQLRHHSTQVGDQARPAPPATNQSTNLGPAPAGQPNASGHQQGQYLEQNQQLADRFHRALVRMQTEASQSLRLRHNNLKFEQFVQLYAILALGPMRRQLYQLDVSHNSLIKLGVTFTGYIEHNLGRAIGRLQQQQQRSSLSWPFGGPPAPLAGPSGPAAQAKLAPDASQQSASQTQQPERQNASEHDQQQVMMLVAGMMQQNEIKQVHQQKLFGPNGAKLRPRQPVLADGVLFNLIVERILAANNNSLAALFHGGWHMNPHQSTAANGSHGASPTSSSNLYQGQQNHQAATSWAHHLQIRALDLSHNKLKWLINDQFRMLKQLQSIRLDHNRISFIHQQAFQGLEALKYINLNYNRIQTIHVEQFQTNYNLLSLSLRANHLAYLRAGSFASLSSLKRLDLSRNKFTLLSNNALVGLDTLEHLNLSSNQFVHVPSASLHPLTSLIKLDLSDNQLAQLVPGTFFHLPIGELWLNKNELLVAIDRGAFWDLPYLRQLHLSSNPMLMSINSQAFVGTQNLQLIDVERSDRLDLETKQMLDNITMAATSRQLRFEQLHQHEPINQSSIGAEPLNRSIQAPGTSTKATIQLATTDAHYSKLNNNTKSNPIQSSASGALAISQSEALFEAGQSGQLEHHQDALLNRWNLNVNYIHSLGFIAFLLVALMFVFRYTATSRYLETRRRARRVYEANPGVPSSSIGSGSLSPSISGSVMNGPDDDDDDGIQSISGQSCMHDRLGDNQMGVNVISLSSLGSDLLTRQRPSGGGGGGGCCAPKSPVCGSSSEGVRAPSDNDHEPASESALQETQYGPLGSPEISDDTSDVVVVNLLDHRQQMDDESGPMIDSSNPGQDIVNEDDKCNTFNDSSVISFETAGPRRDNFCPDCTLPAINMRQKEVASNNDDDNSGAGDGNSSQFMCPDDLGNGIEASCCATQQADTSPSVVMISSEQGIINGTPSSMDHHQMQACLSNPSQTLPSGNINRSAATPTTNSLDLIHSQLVAAGFDYGHANCLHFLQSIGPALQFADLTANYVNQMDYY